jgi:hypothetical protein
MYVGAGSASSVPVLGIKEAGERRVRPARYTLDDVADEIYRGPRGYYEEANDYEYAPNSRQRSAPQLYDARDAQIETQRHEIAELREMVQKLAAGDQTAGDITRDNTGSRRLDLSMFNPAQHDSPGKPPSVNPLSKLQRAQEALALQVQSLQQQLQSVMGGFTQIQQHVSMLEQQGNISQEQAGHMNASISQLQQQLFPPEMLYQGAPSGQGQAPSGAPGMPQQPQAAPSGVPQPQMGGAPGQAPMGPQEVQNPYDPQAAQQMMREGGGPGFVPQTGQQPSVPFEAPESGELLQQPVRRVQPGGGNPARQSPPQFQAPPAMRLNTAIKTTSEAVPPWGGPTTVYKAATIDPQYIHPVDLFKLMGETYGNAWLDWEPETIVQTITNDIGEMPDDEVEINLFAMQALVAASQEFWHNPTVFKNIVLGLNGIDPDFRAPPGDNDGVTPPQIMFAVRVAQELKLLVEPGPEVKLYVGLKFLDRGITYLTPQLAWAQADLDRYLASRRIPANNGAVQQRLSMFAHTPIDEVELSSADPVDTQVAHLLTIRDYVMEREARLGQT